jgi:hypothetical protein
MGKEGGKTDNTAGNNNNKAEWMEKMKTTLHSMKVAVDNMGQQTITDTTPKK